MAMAARKQPLYDQLVDILTEKIENEYRPGDLMPSERELSERYALSRTTVRLALQELERLGLVVRQHGRGTFVADRAAQATNLMQAYSFTNQMRSLGRVPETTVARVLRDRGRQEPRRAPRGAYRRQALQAQALALRRRHAHDGRAHLPARPQVHGSQAPHVGADVALRHHRAGLSREGPAWRRRSSLPASRVPPTPICWISPKGPCARSGSDHLQREQRDRGVHALRRPCGPIQVQGLPSAERIGFGRLGHRVQAVGPSVWIVLELRGMRLAKLVTTR